MHRPPAYKQTTSLVARALGMTPDALTDGFRPATPGDLAQVVAIRKQVFGGTPAWDDANYLMWRYRFGSPSSGRGDCWVATRNGDVIGVLGTEDITLRHGDTTVDGLSVMDIAVRPDLEGVGLGPWMAMHLGRRVPCVVAVGSNPRSRSIVTRIFERLPNRRCYNYYVRFGRPLQRRLNSRVVGSIAGSMADAAMAVWRRAMLPRNSPFSIRGIDRFDASVDSLTARAHDPNDIWIAHDHVSLNWRIFDNPRAKYTVWGAYENAELVGYMAVHTVVLEGGARQLVLEDWLYDVTENRAPAFQALLATALGHAIATRCEDVAVTACHEPSERVMRRIGFVPQLNEFETLSVMSQHDGLNAAIKAGTPWHITGADTDRETS
jgi:hypothetical protein